MLNLNNIGRPLCRIEGGKYANHLVSVTDSFHQQQEQETEGGEGGLGDCGEGGAGEGGCLWEAHGVMGEECVRWWCVAPQRPSIQSGCVLFEL